MSTPGHTAYIAAILVHLMLHVCTPSRPYCLYFQPMAHVYTPARPYYLYFHPILHVNIPTRPYRLHGTGPTNNARMSTSQPGHTAIHGTGPTNNARMSTSQPGHTAYIVLVQPIMHACLHPNQARPLTLRWFNQ